MANTFQAIQTVTVTGSAGDIQFTNIPQTFTDLYVAGSVAGRLTSGTTGALVTYTANGQSSSLANWRNLRGAGSTVTSSASAYPIVGELEYLSGNIFGSFCMYILGYRTNSQKQVFVADSVTGINSGAAYSSFNSLIIDATDPISFLGFGDGSAGGGIKVGSKITLYGIKNT